MTTLGKIYNATIALLLFVTAIPFVLTEDIIKNPRQLFKSLRQLKITLLFFAGL